MSDARDADFATRRLAARTRLDAMDDAGGSDPYRRAWFEAVYDTAGEDPAQVPWADLKAHPLLAAWLAASPAPLFGARALDVGCGLGDNAAALAAKGYDVTAFDLSRRAVEWAQSRHRGIHAVAADVFDPPPEWSGAFDLMLECYTLQALLEAPRAEAMRQIAQFVRPGGALLVIARARENAAAVTGPPWPLTRDDLMRFGDLGLTAQSIEQLADPDDGRSHWRAVFSR